MHNTFLLIVKYKFQYKQITVAITQLVIQTKDVADSITVY